MRVRQLGRETAATAAVVTAGILGVAVWGHDTVALLCLAALVVVWLLGWHGLGRPATFPLALLLCEGFTTAMIAGAGLHDEILVLAALVVPAVTAGLFLGLRGVAVVTGAAAVGLVSTAVLLLGPPDTSTQVGLVVALVVSAALGGAATRSGSLASPGELAPYLNAQTLLRELLALSGDLGSELDAEALGAAVLALVDERLPTSAVALYVPHDDRLRALVVRTGEHPGDLERCESLARAAWARGDAVVRDRSFAWPLGRSAVLAGLLPTDRTADDVGLEGVLASLERELVSRAVRLDTALLFAAYRNEVTSEERRWLARDLDEGVVQDLAVLGGLLGGRERDDLDRALDDLRRTVLTLRSSADQGPSLAASLTTLVDHLGAATRATLHVSADEGATRLDPGSEGEVFGIAKAAVVDALDHPRTTTVDVVCQVRAPHARVEVRDDSRTLYDLTRARSGIDEVRERARAIGAEVTIEELAGGGLAVVLTLGRPDQLPPRLMDQDSASGAAGKSSDRPPGGDRAEGSLDDRGQASGPAHPARSARSASR